MQRIVLHEAQGYLISPVDNFSNRLSLMQGAFQEPAL